MFTILIQHFLQFVYLLVVRKEQGVPVDRVKGVTVTETVVVPKLVEEDDAGGPCVLDLKAFVEAGHDLLLFVFPSTCSNRTMPIFQVSWICCFTNMFWITWWLYIKYFNYLLVKLYSVFCFTSATNNLNYHFFYTSCNCWHLRFGD